MESASTLFLAECTLCSSHALARCALARSKIIGPLTGGERGWPFGCPPDDVAEHGYVMEEFILDGQATSYRVPAGGSASRDGLWDAEPAEAAALAEAL